MQPQEEECQLEGEVPKKGLNSSWIRMSEEGSDIELTYQQLYIREQLKRLPSRSKQLHPNDRDHCRFRYGARRDESFNGFFGKFITFARTQGVVCT